MNSPEPGTEQAATGHLLDLVRTFVTTHMPWKLLLIGAIITGDDRMRLYFRSPERDRTYGVDILVSNTALACSPPWYIRRFWPTSTCTSPPTIHTANVIVDLTDY
ncbi:hypothetical protein [Streptomyces sp. NPDC002952]|uniref:hypothetical protein n=1 Tax=Streptomyces sp. NPDC002952 TaxID=3364673 RepID=UPI0036C1E770